MYPLVEHRGKSFLPVGRKPVIRHIVDKISKAGFSRTVVVISKRDEKEARKYLASLETSVSLLCGSFAGTAKVLEALQGSITRTFLVHYGDVISNVNLKDMMDYHRELGSTATLALVRGQRIELGVATLNESMRVQSFEDQPELRRLVNAAIYVFEPGILKYVKDVRSIEKSIVEMIRSGDRVFGYLTDAYWYHLTHPRDYARVLELVRSGKLRLDRADANRTTPGQGSCSRRCLSRVQVDLGRNKVSA